MEILTALVASLGRRRSLSAAEKDALNNLAWQKAYRPAHTEIVAYAACPTRSCLILEGMAMSYLAVSSGERQIVRLHLPGDFVDLHGLLLETMDHSVETLTDCFVAHVDHKQLRDLIQRMPRLGIRLHALTAIEAAIQRNWLLTLGRKRADERFANLVCELYARLKAVGLTDGWRFEFPVTQAVIADMLGLSVVHTNRVISEFRTAGMLHLERAVAEIKDWDALASIGQFDPGYLNI